MTRRAYSAALAFSAVALVAGCAEDTPEIFIRANQIYADDCEPPRAGGNNVFRNRGTLDLFVTKSYLMAPQVESTLVGSNEVTFGGGGGGSEGLSGAEWEANHISLREAVVRFDAPDALGVPLPRELRIDLSGAISPGGVSTIELKVITDSLGQTLANSRLLREARTSLTLNLRIKFFGTTAAGREVDSNEFIYPVELCYGCLVDFPTEAIDPEHGVQPNCRNTEGFVSDDEGLCFPGQDEPVDCRLICPRLTSNLQGDAVEVCEPTGSVF